MKDRKSWLESKLSKTLKAVRVGKAIGKSHPSIRVTLRIWSMRCSSLLRKRSHYLVKNGSNYFLVKKSYQQYRKTVLGKLLWMEFLPKSEVKYGVCYAILNKNVQTIIQICSRSYLTWTIQVKSTWLKKIYIEHYLIQSYSQLTTRQVKTNCSMCWRPILAMIIKLGTFKVWIIWQHCYLLKLKMRWRCFGVSSPYSLNETGAWSMIIIPQSS